MAKGGYFPAPMVKIKKGKAGLLDLKSFQFVLRRKGVFCGIVGLGERE